MLPSAVIVPSGRAISTQTLVPTVPVVRRAGWIRAGALPHVMPVSVQFVGIL